MSEALKPCPFCGSDDVAAGLGVKYAECNTCDAFGPTAAYPDNAIGAWNTRTDLAATDEQAFANEKVKALVEALRKTVRALGEMTDDDWMGEIDHHAVMLTLHEARVTLAETQDG